MSSRSSTSMNRLKLNSGISSPNRTNKKEISEHDSNHNKSNMSVSEYDYHFSAKDDTQVANDSHTICSEITDYQYDYVNELSVSSKKSEKHHDEVFPDYSGPEYHQIICNIQGLFRIRQALDRVYDRKVELGIIRIYTQLEYYNAACTLQGFYRILIAKELRRVRRIEFAQEEIDKMNQYHEDYLLDLMVSRIQKNVRRMLCKNAYHRRMEKRYDHEIQFLPEHLEYYAIKLQAWYRGNKSRKIFYQNKAAMLKDRYRRSVCANCHAKATVKRCLLCQADFCFSCFKSIHHVSKGQGHHWKYSDAYIRKLDGQLKTKAALLNQSLELDSKYKFNPLHADGIYIPPASKFQKFNSSIDMSTMSVDQWGSFEWGTGEWPTGAGEWGSTTDQWASTGEWPADTTGEWRTDANGQWQWYDSSVATVEWPAGTTGEWHVDANGEWKWYDSSITTGELPAAGSTGEWRADANGEWQWYDSSVEQRNTSANRQRRSVQFAGEFERATKNDTNETTNISFDNSQSHVISNSVTQTPHDNHSSFSLIPPDSSSDYNNSYYNDQSEQNFAVNESSDDFINNSNNISGYFKTEVIQDNGETNGDEEIIEDELLTNNPYDSYTNFPLALLKKPSHNNSKKSNKGNNADVEDVKKEEEPEDIPGQFYLNFDSFFKKTTIAEKSTHVSKPAPSAVAMTPSLTSTNNIPNNKSNNNSAVDADKSMAKNNQPQSPQNNPTQQVQDSTITNKVTTSSTSAHKNKDTNKAKKAALSNNAHLSPIPTTSNQSKDKPQKQKKDKVPNSNTINQKSDAKLAVTTQTKKK